MKHIENNQGNKIHPDATEESHEPTKPTSQTIDDVPEKQDMKTYPCDKCNLHMGSKNYLNTHISSFHGEINTHRHVLHEYPLCCITWSRGNIIDRWTWF